MRKLSLYLAAVCVVPFSVAQVHAEDQGTPGRTFYKDGVNLEYGDDFDMKLNLLFQPRYEFTDVDISGRQENGVDDGETQDSSSFSLRRVRLIMSGNLMNDQFSYKLQNDFASNSGGGDLKDAWLQWNGEWTNVRFGQYKVPFTRQEIVSSSHLYFPERSLAQQFFTADRDTGAMLHGELGETAHYYAGVFNGESDGEGRNQRGVDPHHNAAFALDYSTPDYGSRGYEGDLRGSDGPFGATVGGSLIYGEGEATFGDTFSDFDQLKLNADAGIRCNGADLQGEFYWQEIDPESFGGSTGKADNVGFYLQASYTMDKLGFGGRYSLITPDDDVQDLIDDQQEYSLVLNYFIKGHHLKLQNSVTWAVTSFQGNGDDVTDFQYILQLSGLI